MSEADDDNSGDCEDGTNFALPSLARRASISRISVNAGDVAYKKRFMIKKEDQDD